MELKAVLFSSLFVLSGPAASIQEGHGNARRKAAWQTERCAQLAAGAFQRHKNGSRKRDISSPVQVTRLRAGILCSKMDPV
jgi:hypothetical protein